MDGLEAKSGVKRVQIEIEVIRADGRRENLGVVSDSAPSWRFGPGRLAAWRRTQQANRRTNGQKEN